MPNLNFECEYPLDAVILPRFTGECSVKLPSTRVLQLPECCFNGFSLWLDNYYQAQIKLTLHSDTDITIKDALYLENIEICLPESLDVQDTSSNLYFKIRKAPKLKLLKITQPDLGLSNFLNINIGIDEIGSYDVILDCNCEYIKLSAPNANQVLNIYCSYSIDILSLYYIYGESCKINIYATKPGIAINSIQLCERNRTYHSTFYPDRNGLLDRDNGLIEDLESLADLPRVMLNNFDYNTRSFQYDTADCVKI